MQNVNDDEIVGLTHTTSHASISANMISTQEAFVQPRGGEIRGEERMKQRWSRLSPQLALAPAAAVTLVAFAGSILWTIYVSFTQSRRLPDYAIDWSDP